MKHTCGFFTLLAVAATLAAAHTARADDSGWPRQFDSSSGSFVIYQPQPEDLDGDQLSCRAAFSLQTNQEAQPAFGVLWFTEHVAIDRDASTVTGRITVNARRLAATEGSANEAGRPQTNPRRRLSMVSRFAAGQDEISVNRVHSAVRKTRGQALVGPEGDSGTGIARRPVRDAGAARAGVS